MACVRGVSKSLITIVILTLISLNTKDPHSAATSPYPYREETKQTIIEHKPMIEIIYF